MSVSWERVTVQKLEEKGGYIQKKDQKLSETCQQTKGIQEVRIIIINQMHWRGLIK